MRRAVKHLTLWLINGYPIKPGVQFEARIKYNPEKCDGNGIRCLGLTRINKKIK